MSGLDQGMASRLEPSVTSIDCFAVEHGVLLQGCVSATVTDQPICSQQLPLFLGGVEIEEFGVSHEKQVGDNVF